MDDEVHVIEQDPVGLFVALGVGDAEAEGFEALVDGVGDGLDLARVGSAAHDEVVGESSRIFFEFENGDIVGLFVLTGEEGFNHLVLEVIFFLHTG